VRWLKGRSLHRTAHGGGDSVDVTNVGVFATPEPTSLVLIGIADAGLLFAAPSRPRHAKLIGVGNRPIATQCFSVHFHNCS
jgi:hypothetical protein